MTLDELQRAINRWQDATFPRATLSSTFRHFQQEVAEAEEALHTTGPGKSLGEELADLQILLFAVAGKAGVVLADAVAEKMAVNQAREWQEPDAYGVVYHKREEGEHGSGEALR